MRTHPNRYLDFIRDGDGASATEYALLLGVIALAIVAGMSMFGTTLGDYYMNNIAAKMPW
jgi:Flp pilus assembly pilin Flp